MILEVFCLKIVKNDYFESTKGSCIYFFQNYKGKIHFLNCYQKLIKKRIATQHGRKNDFRFQI